MSMQTRRDLLKHAGAAAVLAAVAPVTPAHAHARKPTLNIAFTSLPETIDPISSAPC
jgi:hypothetical protein